MPNPTDIFGNLGWLNKWVKNLLGRVRAIENSGAGSYKVYTALLNYNDLANPIVLENNLGGDITWSASYPYLIVGNSTNDIFTENKTIGFCYGGSDDDVSYFLGFLVKTVSLQEIHLIDPTVNIYGSINIRLEIRVYN